MEIETIVVYLSTLKLSAVVNITACSLMRKEYWTGLLLLLSVVKLQLKCATLVLIGVGFLVIVCNFKLCLYQRVVVNITACSLKR